MKTADSNYIERQEQHNREYLDAWENAPESFKVKAAMLGLSEPELEEETSLDVREFDDNYSSSSIKPDMAAALDEYVDEVIEKRGIQHAVLIRQIFEDLKIPMRDEITRASSNLLGRIAGYLIYMDREKGNMMARIHALLHAVPRFASEAGYGSMRKSAKVCKVSPEWLRRKRDQWCILLGLEPPAEGIKSDTAKEKYRKNAIDNHWRTQKFTKKKL